MLTKITWWHWLFLMISIIGEVFGTSIMKISHSWNFPFASQFGLIIMWLSLGLSYFYLAKASMAIPIGVAFALWDAIGLIIIVGVSVLFLNETLDLKASLGLVCILCGGFLVHQGTDSHNQENIR